MQRRLLPAVFVWLFPSLARAQGTAAKPEVANAAKASRRAWIDASAEQQAAWQAERDAITNIDLASDSKVAGLTGSAQDRPAPLQRRHFRRETL